MISILLLWCPCRAKDFYKRTFSCSFYVKPLYLETKAQRVLWFCAYTRQGICRVHVIVSMYFPHAGWFYNAAYFLHSARTRS